MEQARTRSWRWGGADAAATSGRAIAIAWRARSGGVGVLTLLAMLAAATGEAAELRCGATVRGAITLSADLSDCPGAGLRIAGTSVLDCAGHAISGSGGGEGLVLDRTIGAEVRNCRVQGFATGIRIRGGAANRIADSEVLGSARYGIELATGARDSRIEGNRIAGSGDEGIHVGSGADGSEIVDNEIHDNGRENVYLLSVRDCAVVGNRISGARSASLYVKHASGCAIGDNDVEDRPVHVRGASRDNLFAGNRLRGAGFVFEAYRDGAGWTVPRENTVEEGSVEGVSTCFRFAGAQDNVVQGVAIGRCRPIVLQSVGKLPASGNRVETVRLAPQG